MAKKIWEVDANAKATLETAGWRYAILIGITGSPEQIEEYKADQTTYRHLIKKTPDGKPIWNDTDASQIVSDWTGYDVDTCAQWLAHDWH